MPSTAGDFGGPKAPKQCTAMSKRTGKRCKGPAILGSRTQKCRMHGGGALYGRHAPGFENGSHSMYLPSQLGELYQESLNNPDLLEMSSHIALLEARMHEILGESTMDNPVPRWNDVMMAASELNDALVDSSRSGGKDKKDKEKAAVEAASKLNEMVKAGMAWDTTWEQVTGLMNEIRKLTDTEVRRKKELNQMVPVERVIVLMVAVGDAIKRCVTNQEEVAKVQREISRLVMSDTTAGGRSRLNAMYAIDVPPGQIGLKGGRSWPARLRREKREREMAAAQGADK